MKTVSVNKGDLQATIKVNLEKHTKEFLLAKKNYSSKVANDLADESVRISSGGKPKTSYLFPLPVTYAGSYQEALEMLKWETSDIVQLTADEFKQFIKNEWYWAESFSATTSFYNS